MNGLWKIALLALFAVGSLEEDASAQNGVPWTELLEAQVALYDGGRLVYSYDPGQRSDGDARAIALRGRTYYCASTMAGHVRPGPAYESSQLGVGHRPA